MSDLLDRPYGQPCLILAHPNKEYAEEILLEFCRQGWDVYPARSGLEARRLAWLLQANLVVLATALPDESGFLTCAKLTQELPQLKVVLLCSENEPRDNELARFVGAAVVCGDQEGADLLSQLSGDLLPVVSETV